MRRGIFIKGEGREYFIIRCMFGSKDGKGGEVGDINQIYVLFTRGMQVFYYSFTFLSL
jgi:hypothetical protein